MATTIKIKSSVSAGKVPATLQPAELAINLKDKKLFSADVDGTVFEISSGGGGTVGTLQEVTDAGNTTTNDIEVENIQCNNLAADGAITGDGSQLSGVVPLGSWAGIPALT